MSEYDHGGDVLAYKQKVKGEIIDYSINLNPLPIPQNIHEAVCSATIDAYPDPYCRKLTNEYSKKYNINSQHLLFANGAADLIYRIAHVLKPKKALLFEPSFSEYTHALETVQCSIKYNINSNKMIDESFLDDLSNDIDIVFLCNPNNPTGQAIENDLMIKIIQKCKDYNIYIVIDECFISFADISISLKNKITAYSNLLILDAFTKSHSLAGLRLGVLLCSNINLLSKIRNIAQDWSVSSVAQVAGIVAMNNDEYIKKANDIIRKEKKYLMNALKPICEQVYISDANFIMFKHKQHDLQQLLLEKNILIRDCSNFRGLDKGFYRIAIKQHNINLKLINAMKNLV